MNRYAGFRVMIVDDNENNLYSLNALIGKYMDVEVIQAASGQAALEMALDDPRIDLIVLDIQMPEMDGYEVMQEIRSRPDLEGLPVVALTARAGDEDRDRSLQAGAADCLVKPVDTGELKTMLDRYLANTEDKGVA